MQVIDIMPQKWMRIDFREERRWKLALAYTLAQAVVDWHAAGSKEERERLGICLNWKKPRAEELEEEQVDAQLEPEYLPVDIDDETGGESKSNSTPANEENSNSDDDSDDEREREQRVHRNAVESQAAIDDALVRFEAVAQSQQTDGQSQHDIQPKMEDVEDRSVLHADDTMDVDGPAADTETTKPSGATPKTEESSTHTTGLKTTSSNPVLTGPALPKDSPTKSKTKASTYAHLREQIVHSDLDKLVLDMDDFDLVQGMSELSTEEVLAMPPPPADLSAIFPDLQPFGMLDVAPVVTEGKKKSDRRADRDDPNKRAEDTTYQKVTPMSEFIYHKATLVGSLRPARHWRDGHWHDLDETTIVADFETPTARPIDDSVSCCTSMSNFVRFLLNIPSLALFESGKSHSPALGPPHLPASLGREFRRRSNYEAVMEGRGTPGGGPMYHYKPRTADIIWTPQEDAVLKQLVDKWSNNWSLIADSFNSSRTLMASERRSAMECFERWRTRLNGSSGEDDNRPPPTPTTQMTTRGTKRSLSMSVSTSNTGAYYGGEPRKRRRHTVMYDTIRKAAKKKEAAQKANGDFTTHYSSYTLLLILVTAANQRKPAAIHDTHGQYNKMPKIGPQELSRMKAEKDARENREQMILRQRQSDLETTRIMQQRAQQGGQPPTVSGVSPMCIDRFLTRDRCRCRTVRCVYPIKWRLCLFLRFETRLTSVSVTTLSLPVLLARLLWLMQHMPHALILDK